MKNIDFAVVFESVQSVESANELMDKMICDILKYGHHRIDLLSGKGKIERKSSEKKDVAKTSNNTKAAKTSAKEKSTKSSEKPKAAKSNEDKKKMAETSKGKNERKSSDEIIKQRVAFIKSCKPGTSVEVKAMNFRTKQVESLVVDIPTKSALKKMELEAVDYSDSSFVVIGNTKDISKYLRHILGGTFNGYLKCGAGWIFAKNEQGEAVKKALSLAM